MDEDEYVFELFLETIQRIEEYEADGRLRMLSKNPRYEVTPPAQKQPNKKHIEKR